MVDLIHRWRVAALDFRGHGKSARTPGRYRLEDYAGDALLPLRQLGGSPSVLFGHSLGGRVALTLARQQPKLVKAVIVGDTPLTAQSLNSRTDFLDVFRLWAEIVEEENSVDCIARRLAALPAPVFEEGRQLTFRELPGWDGAYLRYTARCLVQVDPEILENAASGRDAESYDVLGTLDDIACPVLFLQGNPDLGGLLTDEDLERALDTAPRASAVRIETAGHDLHLQDREPVLRAVQLFFESL